MEEGVVVTLRVGGEEEEGAVCIGYDDLRVFGDNG